MAVGLQSAPTELYSSALLEKLKNWTSKTDIHVYGPDDLRRIIETKADIDNDAPLTLPLITLSNTSGFEIINYAKRPLTFDGLTKDATLEKSKQINAVPISIPYQLDVYTKFYSEADSYMRELIFNIINHPTFEVHIPYNGDDLVMYGNVRIASNGIENNSSIPERLIPGQFTRLTAQLSVDDAYLWDLRIRNNFYISGADVESDN